jgi:hypothetical protein
MGSCMSFECRLCHTGCEPSCPLRPRYFYYVISEDTAGNRWRTSFEAGSTGPLGTEEEKDPPPHFSLDSEISLL